MLLVNLSDQYCTRGSSGQPGPGDYECQDFQKPTLPTLRLWGVDVQVRRKIAQFVIENMGVGDPQGNHPQLNPLQYNEAPYEADKLVQHHSNQLSGSDRCAESFLPPRR